MDAAGSTLIDANASPTDLEQALVVINNWRSSHSFPLNTFQVWLRKKTADDPTSVAAQRIKRLSSIKDKLRRFSWLRLSEMQDIGGLRAVVATGHRVGEVAKLYRGSALKHKLDDSDDYIQSPKKSGYRGIHLIYRYHSDRKQTYEGLKVEIQLRSRLQHLWATAVETVGTFLRQSLKASHGDEEWLRFFALMGSELAKRERTPPVPGTPEDAAELRAELRELTRQLDVANRLQMYGAVIKYIDSPDVRGARYFLLHLDPEANRVRLTAYRAEESEKASNEYLAVERAIAEAPGAEAVLVSVQSLTALRRAYPNYFLDTTEFLKALAKAIAADA